MGAKEQFGAKVRELMREARLLSPAVRKSVIELLEEARKKIVGEISSLDPKSFQGAQARALALEIDRALEQFREKLTQQVKSDESRAYQLGQAQIDQPLAAAGLPTPSFAGLSSSVLAIAQGYTADLISGLTKDAAGKLNAAIQRAFLGGQSVGDIIEQVGRAIDGGKEFSGLFSPIGERATMIATNEILRVHSMAAQDRLEDLSGQLPGIMKKWAHVPIARVPRFAHLQADGQVRDVAEPFDVGGEQLMYPRDPNGSPENTINCHCLLIPEVSKDMLQPSESQKRLLKNLGLSASVS
jgi:hypothetical protein